MTHADFHVALHKRRHELLRVTRLQFPVPEQVVLELAWVIDALDFLEADDRTWLKSSCGR